MFDIETERLEDPQKIHCLSVFDMKTGTVQGYTDDSPDYPPISEGLVRLSTASMLIGHNAMRFDLRVLKSLRGWSPTPTTVIRDTLLCSRVIIPDIDQDDHKLDNFPGKLIGSHSLQAWGVRLGVLKGKHGQTPDAFDKWTKELQDYCNQDVVVTGKLWSHLRSKNPSHKCISLEHEFAEIIYDMIDFGFAFDEKAAVALYERLVKRREELKEVLQKTFPPVIEEMKTRAYWTGSNGQHTTKSKAGKDAKPGPFKTKEHPFNPGSRVQVAERLKALGWTPSAFTETGQPKIDDDILAALPYEETKPLAEFYLVSKRISQLAEGDSAWLKKVKRGRIHGDVITNGAGTGRCTHSNPNVAQVPRVGTPYGVDCRTLFGPSPSRVQVGADASGLELRGLAHYLCFFGGSEYVEAVCGPDIHTVNQSAFGLPPGKAYRPPAKNGIYALVYGAQDEKLGSTLGPLEDSHERQAQSVQLTQHERMRLGKKGPLSKERVANHKRGKYARAKVSENIPGFGSLVNRVQGRVGRGSHLGTLSGIDGRVLRCRGQHSALNTLIQSWGAVVVKQATVLWKKKLESLGLKWREDFMLLAHIHDEIQAECKPEHAKTVGQAFVDALKETAEMFNLRCPLSGEYKVGANWAETH